jgi:hypothetical protein
LRIKVSDKEALDSLVRDDDFRELSRILKLRPPNIFRILGIEHEEIRWSAFLAWLLDPGENHGLKDQFLRAFLEDVLKNTTQRDLHTVDIHVMGLSNVEVRKEEDFGEDGRGDIVIRCVEDRLLCIIENKVRKWESLAQTERYSQAAKRIMKEEDFDHAICVFLTPCGDEAESAEFVPYGYRDILKLIESVVVPGEHVSQPVQGLIEQFKDNVREEIGMGESEDKIRSLCHRLISKHQEAVEKLAQHLPTTDNFLNQLFNAIRETHTFFEPEYARGSGWVTLSPKGWQKCEKRRSDLYYKIEVHDEQVSFNLEWANQKPVKFNIEGVKEVVKRLLDKQKDRPNPAKLPPSRMDWILAQWKTRVFVPKDFTGWTDTIERLKQGFADFLERFPIEEFAKIPGVKST